MVARSFASKRVASAFTKSSQTYCRSIQLRAILIGSLGRPFATRILLPSRMLAWNGWAKMAWCPKPTVTLGPGPAKGRQSNPPVAIAGVEQRAAAMSTYLMERPWLLLRLSLVRAT